MNKFRNIFKNDVGKKVVSVIFGLGLVCYQYKNNKVSCIEKNSFFST
jgi:hypothetical protein